MIEFGRGWLFVMICASGLGAMSAAPAEAQAALHANTNTMVPAYDMAKEVKVQGTIEKIDGFGTAGPIGTHILIQTATGMVDAHLGFGPAASAKHLGLSLGERVSVIGMMETVGHNSVLMARILTTPSHIFVLRNEHGIPIRATPHGSPRPGMMYTMLASGWQPAINADGVRGGL